MTSPTLDCMNAIITRLAANWSTTPIVYDNIDYIPDVATPFIYCGINIADESLKNLASPGYNGAMYRKYGYIDINILTPSNQGVGVGIGYADTISSIFRSQTFNNVLCFTPVVTPRGRQNFQTGNWWSTTVVCPFNYDFIL